MCPDFRMARWSDDHDRWVPSEPTGVESIGLERERQVEVEGWSSDHDDEHETDMALLLAAACYVEAAEFSEGCENAGLFDGRVFPYVPPRWPWQEWGWKPTADARRNLVKAGALLAAEIDRLDRKAKGGTLVDLSEGEGGLPYHLRSDSPPLFECDSCGRKLWSKPESNRCKMPQPDENLCDGWLRVCSDG